MEVLVTGGAGFIGSWTVEELVKRGYRVVVVDDFSSGSIENLEHLRDRVTIAKLDIRDAEGLRELFQRHKFDAVVHLAAIVSVDEVSMNPYRGFSVNVAGTLNILELCRRYDVGRIVYASSAAVYGEPTRVPVKTSDPLNPTNVYGATKLAGEALVQAYHGNYGLKTISLRYFNVYGPRMKPGPYAGVVYKFIANALRGEPLIIYGDGLQTRDFVYVRDVAQANAVALEKTITGVYNVGTGVETRIIDLAHMVLELTGSNSGVVYTSPRPGDIRRSCADIGETIRVLGWRPETSLVEGLRRTIEYMRKRL